MKRIQYWLMCFITLLLCSCANKPISPETWLTKGVKVNLPAPHFDHVYHDQQLLTFSYNGQQHSLITMIDAQNDALSVVGLSTLGIRLFKIDYYGKVITTEQNIFIKELPSASQILSDIMFSILPIEQWQPLLPKGWQLIDTTEQRLLINEQQQTVIEIKYRQPPSSQIRKPTNIKHHIFGYQIAISSME